MQRGVCPICMALINIIQGDQAKPGFSARIWWAAKHYTVGDKVCIGSGERVA